MRNKNYSMVNSRECNVAPIMIDHINNNEPPRFLGAVVIPQE